MIGKTLYFVHRSSPTLYYKSGTQIFSMLKVVLACSCEKEAVKAGDRNSIKSFVLTTVFTNNPNTNKIFLQTSFHSAYNEKNKPAQDLAIPLRWYSTLGFQGRQIWNPS